MKNKSVNSFAASLNSDTAEAVKSASATKFSARARAAESYFGDQLDPARSWAASIKDAVLSDLRANLETFECNCLARGVIVHWAEDAETARQLVTQIASTQAAPGDIIAKAKSMVTEEIHLNSALEAAGFEVVETDLGEFVLQLDQDTPSHIVSPILHKSRVDVARTFRREGLGDYSEDPETLTLQARAWLRDKFRRAKVGISGVNFGIIESGRLVLVENEGNSRLSTTAPNIHIALMGIEKLIPRESDLPTFLRLLSLSSTGQQLTTYVHFIGGPQIEGEPDGPKEVHLIILDNGRSRVLNSEFREALRCIRCGACLNVCPVYRQASGHAYPHVYCGPIGAVLAPILDPEHVSPEVAFASTLCGLCESVCPVKIPLHDLLVRHRKNATNNTSAGVWNSFDRLTTRTSQWTAALRLLPMASELGLTALNGWSKHHASPKPAGRNFRRWWNDRS